MDEEDGEVNELQSVFSLLLQTVMEKDKKILGVGGVGSRHNGEGN